MATNPLGSLFGPNPFRSIQEHMRQVIDCVDEVPLLFEALAAGDQTRVAAIKDRIFEKEEAADRVKNELRKHLPRGLFLPTNRSDLLEILDLQDSMADVAQDIAGLLVERRMTIPAPLAEQIMPFARRCVDVCHQAAGAIEQLDELLEMGFKGREVSRVEERIQELNETEDETDRMGMALARTLFLHEDDMKPVSVMFWYRLIEWIGDLADYAEKVGNRLRLVIAR